MHIDTELERARQAELAFAAFAALRRLAQSEPHLIENEYFTALQDSAYARFRLRFEACL